MGFSSSLYCARTILNSRAYIQMLFRCLQVFGVRQAMDEDDPSSTTVIFEFTFGFWEERAAKGRV